MDDAAVKELVLAVVEQACKDYLMRYPPSSADGAKHKTPWSANNELKNIERVFAESWLLDLVPDLSCRYIVDFLKQKRRRKFGQIYYSESAGRSTERGYPDRRADAGN